MHNLWRSSNTRALPHPISEVGLIGGGQVPLPGEVSLAHHGMLFLDDRPCSVLYRRQAGTQTPRTPSTAPLPFARAASMLDTIPGIDQRGAELVVAEWGSDMARFGTVARLADRPNLDGLCGVA